MKSSDYIKIEQDFMRIQSALKSISDKETIETLNKLSFVVSEIRHAAVSLDDGALNEDVTKRLMEVIFPALTGRSN